MPLFCLFRETRLSTKMYVYTFSHFFSDDFRYSTILIGRFVEDRVGLRVVELGKRAVYSC